MMPLFEQTPILALQGGDREEIQAFLKRMAERWRAAGRDVIGVVEEFAPSGRAEDTVLRDLASGAVHRLHQDLGSGAAGCSLDPQGLAAACAGVEAAIRTRLARAERAARTIVVLSKFGRQEAEGQGLTSAFHAAVAAELPILTSVSPAVADQWAAFAGEFSRLVPLDPAMIEDWCAHWLEPEAASA